MPKKTVFALLAVTALLAGCANAILSDNRIRSNTALALNQAGKCRHHLRSTL
jgi:nitrous oxide reductase accessory protein NosL